MNMSAEAGSSTALSRWIVHFIAVMQAVFRLSDVVVNYFLAFFRVLFRVLGQNPSAGAVTDIAKNLPSTVHTARQFYKNMTFRRYVVCKMCHKLYYFADCIEGASSKRSKVCCFCKFPLHPFPSRRKQCGGLLLKTVEMSSGKKFFYPFMTYCYMGLEVSLQGLLNRPAFFNSCGKWKERVEDGILRDVWDGQVWKEFLKYDGEPFLSEDGNFALMLNMDFFQPYKHVQYSVGAIYLCVMNLPRNTRYKQENVLLVGLIPGPSEPKHDINSFLDPLVDELLNFWSGVQLDVAGHECKKKVRCALLCVACDIPAGRKVCGFLGHSARLGCSRCYKEFPGGVGSMDYSGFQPQSWCSRDGAKHTSDSLRLLTINTKTKLQQEESSNGCRYSVLIKLPYFNAPRMLIVDPMHNLYIGSAKHFLRLLIDNGSVSESQFDIIQERVDSFIVPSDTGRIPHKIRSGFSSFTADQWKNWVVYFSVIALRDILPDNEMKCWRYFVQACRVLQSKCITQEQIQLGNTFLIKFCRRTEHLFGKESVTPNMHMHCHLAACISDYGPLHGFWLFAFERYNGILGSMPNNNRSIEVQLMGRFLRESEVLSSSFPCDFFEEFAPLFPEYKTAGSVADTLSGDSIPVPLTSFVEVPRHEITFPKHFTNRVLTSSQKHNLVELYTELYSISRSALEMCDVYRKYCSVLINGKQLGSHGNRTMSSSVVMVKWDSGLFGDGGSESPNCRAARVEFTCKHVITVNEVSKTVTLVSLSWYKMHPKSGVCGKPATIWYYDLFEPDNIYTLVPIQFIISRCVSLIDKLDGESVLFVCPCVDF